MSRMTKRLSLVLVGSSLLPACSPSPPDAPRPPVVVAPTPLAERPEPVKDPQEDDILPVPPGDRPEPVPQVMEDDGTAGDPSSSQQRRYSYSSGFLLLGRSGYHTPAPVRMIGPTVSTFTRPVFTTSRAGGFGSTGQSVSS